MRGICILCLSCTHVCVQCHVYQVRMAYNSSTSDFCKLRNSGSGGMALEWGIHIILWIPFQSVFFNPSYCTLATTTGAIKKSREEREDSEVHLPSWSQDEYYPHGRIPFLGHFFVLHIPRSMELFQVHSNWEIESAKGFLDNREAPLKTFFANQHQA